MADNINLIPAAELPITEAKEVDVLCVENGELKRKAGANLGGGGYIIHVPAADVQLNDQTRAITVTLSESRDNFAPILEAGGSVWLDMSEFFSVITGGAFSLSLVAVAEWGWSVEAYAGVFVMMAMEMMTGSAINVMCPNGTWTPPEA